MDPEPIDAGFRDVARSMEFSLDRAVYHAAGRDPLDPIVYAGSLAAPLAFLARDLGKDEVALGEPLIGGAGRRVRRAVYRFLFDAEPPPEDKYLREALGHILLTNTVPYKPVGNKAYPPSVRERFRPCVATVFACAWEGSCVITLGTEAFLWFARYGEPGAFEAFWKREDRYYAEISCRITAEGDGAPATRELSIAPLPHPSPLNRAYLEQFPAMLDYRLTHSPLARERARLPGP